MQTVQAYRAGNGSIHETRESAAVADLVDLLGLHENAANMIVHKHKAVSEILNQISGLAYITAYLPQPEAPAAEAP